MNGENVYSGGTWTSRSADKIYLGDKLAAPAVSDSFLV